MAKNNRAIFPIIIVFVILNGVFLACRNMLERNGIDQEVLIVGNLVLFAATAISFSIAKMSLRSANPNAFVRGIYLSIMLKLFACIIAALIYIAIFKKDINKPALFTCMGLYLVYTFVEVRALTRLLKEKANA
jgi:hypothetical protein